MGASMKEVIIRKGGAHRSSASVVVDVAPVIRETKTLVVAGHGGKEKYRLKKIDGEFSFPSAKEIAKAEKELAALRATQQATRDRIAAQEAAERADPRYPLLRRFKSGTDFEPWDKLTLEQLQTIADILDSVK
ncbi:MAG: hypothetical protein HY000_30975 [Planctomycetes bacterium]|nr:hypothetical protein [Planctomycetota bacterium]